MRPTNQPNQNATHGGRGKNIITKSKHKILTEIRTTKNAPKSPQNAGIPPTDFQPEATPTDEIESPVFPTNRSLTSLTQAAGLRPLASHQKAASSRVLIPAAAGITLSSRTKPT